MECEFCSYWADLSRGHKQRSPGTICPKKGCNGVIWPFVRDSRRGRSIVLPPHPCDLEDWEKRRDLGLFDESRDVEAEESGE